MKEEKAEFIKKFQKHQIKAKDEDFEKALQGNKQSINVISVAKQKRESEDDLEEIETSIKKDKKKHIKR